nr:UDP-N-acetylmuramate:L-alanyl-gamma-D-glutamyl-meso-diaminopimelate ligase [Desulfobulbaceae bacterium]
MGICGTGVGALAGMLKKKGYIVTGSDQHVYPPMSDFLDSLGIGVKSSYKPENLNPKPDLVIVGNVIRRDNPEAVALENAGIHYLSMPQALSHFFLGDKTCLVVCGTHGKTTTASLLATMLHFIGNEPGFMIGGIVQAFKRNFNISPNRYFVIEGDEYDTAFFDKGPKFLHYRPQIAIITSIEFDHADIYSDLEAVKASFSKLVAIMPKSGAIVANIDDEIVRDIVSKAGCKVVGYGLSKHAQWSYTDLDIGNAQTTFTALKDGAIFAKYTSNMPGHHNAMNALAVTAVLDLIGIPSQDCTESLAKFPGVRRRQEVRGVRNGITIIDDFAHHPTAVKETLAALRKAYAQNRLVAVFEPRTNSSRKNIFQTAYAQVFSQADEILIKKPIPLDSLPEDQMFSSSRLADDLAGQGKKAASFETTDSIINYIKKTAQHGDVLVIMSNGGFDDIHNRLLSEL